MLVPTQSIGKDAESHLPPVDMDFKTDFSGKYSSQKMFESGIVENSIDTAAILRCVEETLTESQYKNVLKSCSIQYSIENKSPFCCIELQHPVDNDSLPSSDEIRTFLRNEITQLSKIGIRVEYTVGFESSENPELFSLIDSDHLWNEMSDRLAEMDSTGLRSILNELTSQLRESNDCFVMFGPRYSCEEKQWSSELALWVCVASPWARRFLPQIHYVRPQSVQSINVQYWSLTVSRQVKLLPSESNELWVAKEGDFFRDFFYPTSISPGQRLCIPPPAGYSSAKTPFFTLGPSLCCFSRDKEESSRNSKFYITAAHPFQKDPTTIAKRRSECHEDGTSFEYWSSYGVVVGSLVYIPTDPANNITHDLALVSISSRVRSSTDLLVGHKKPRSRDHTDSNKLTLSVSGYRSSSLQLAREATTIGAKVYKNGGSTGLSKGDIVTIGQEWIANRVDEGNAKSIENYNQGHSDRNYFIVKAISGNFSEKGDSGSPVWRATTEGEDAKAATVVGILSGCMKSFPNFSVVALMDDAVISSFLEKARGYRQ